MPHLSDAMRAAAAATDAALDALLPGPDGPEARLHEAMRYAVLGPGKRLRPFLTISSAAVFGLPAGRAVRTAAAIEMVHAYSLVHDDLPAMDDDDLRRGRPTVHIAYDEATAILAGDALLALAFEVLAEPETADDPAIRAALVAGLARASGPAGMVAGQVLDLAGAAHTDEFGWIVRMERLKTGAIIGFACEAGAMLAAASKADRAALWAYGQDLGLAFQVADDILDLEGDEAEIGKRVRKDDDAGKATIPALIGVDEARREAHILVEQAMAHLDRFGPEADLLRETARFVVERRS